MFRPLAKMRLTQSQRIEVSVLSKVGWSIEKLRKKFNVSSSTIQRCRRTPELPPRRPRRQANKVTAKIKRLEKLLRYHPFASCAELAALDKKLGCTTTVRNLLAKAGYKNWKRPIACKEQPTDAARRARFVNKAQKLGKNTRWFFSDEKRWDLNCYSRQTQWAKNSSVVKKCVRLQFQVKLLVWVMIGVDKDDKVVKKIEFLEPKENMNAVRYQAVLKKHVVPLLGKKKMYRFQQDGASCHTAGTTKSMLKRCQVTFENEWPPRSPYLNPVENLFAIMSRAVCKYRAKDLTELHAVVRRVFDELPDSTVSGLVKSFQGRLGVVKGLRGGVPGRQPALHARKGRRQEV